MKKLGCAKCGKSMAKGGAKKMAKGGSMKKMADGGNAFIAGIPNAGPTGPNYQGIDTMKKGGVMKKKMAVGGSLKEVDSTKNPGLAKLPTEVRNKMGYEKKGGAMKAKFGASVKVQRSPKAGKVRAAGDQGYAAVGKREPGRIIKKVISKKK